MGTIYTVHFFTQTFSNFTCMLFMMKGGTHIDFGSGGDVKGQGQIWQSVFKTMWTRYRLQFLLNRFQTSHVSC